MTIKLTDLLTEKEKRIYQKNWDGAPPKGAKIMTGPKGGQYYMASSEKGRPDKGDARGTKTDTKKRDGEKPTRAKKGDIFKSKKAVKVGKDIAKGAPSDTDKKAPTTKSAAKQVSKYGAKQKGIGAGLDNLTGPKTDKDAIGPSAEKEKAVLKKLQAIGPNDNVDLCTVTVPGTNMFCAGNKGIPRAEMPQLKSKVIPGGKADKMVKAGKLDIDPKNGEVNTEGLFKDMLEKEGIKMSDPTPEKVSDLKATQNQLEGSKVNMFAKVLAGEQPFPDKELSKEQIQGWQDALREPIIVSKDGYILDGHHRWAAMVQHDVANGGGGDVEMDTKRVEMGAEALVKKTNAFTNDMGLAVKKKKPKGEGIIKLKDLIEGRYETIY